MTWFEDLAPCDYFGSEYAEGLRAVGWLNGVEPFWEGDCEPALLRKLGALFRDAWQPVACMGFHNCELCPPFEGPHSASNIFVPGDGLLYIAPEGILHYIKAHRYVPPMEFQAAVMRCPDMKSPAYLDLVREHGGAIAQKWLS